METMLRLNWDMFFPKFNLKTKVGPGTALT